MTFLIRYENPYSAKKKRYENPNKSINREVLIDTLTQQNRVQYTIYSKILLLHTHTHTIYDY